jgi:hypothetical protein
MPKNHRTLTRSLAAGLALCAIAPGTALAMPAIGGPPAPAHQAPDAARPAPRVAANGGAGVTAQDYRSLDYRAPAQTGSRGDGAAKQAAPAQPTAPQWPTNPQPIARPHSVSTANPATDDGVDTGVWIVLAAAGLTLAGGVGFASGKRLRPGRPAQLA